jgi:hypothetical protein
MKQWIRGPKHILVQLKCITKRSRRSNLGRTGKGEENSCFSSCPMIVKLWSDPFQVCSPDCSFCNLSNYHIDMVHLWWLEGNATFQTLAFIQVVCLFWKGFKWWPPCHTLLSLFRQSSTPDILFLSHHACLV